MGENMAAIGTACAGKDGGRMTSLAGSHSSMPATGKDLCLGGGNPLPPCIQDIHQLSPSAAGRMQPFFPELKRGQPLSGGREGSDRTLWLLFSAPEVLGGPGFLRRYATVQGDSCSKRSHPVARPPQVGRGQSCRDQLSHGHMTQKDQSGSTYPNGRHQLWSGFRA